MALRFAARSVHARLAGLASSMARCAHQEAGELIKYQISAPRQIYSVSTYRILPGCVLSISVGAIAAHTTRLNTVLADNMDYTRTHSGFIYTILIRGYFIGYPICLGG